MNRTMYTALAATVALPMLATSAAAQQDRGYGYSPSRDMGYHWSESRGAIERDPYYAGDGRAPSPPRTPDRYITDWDQSAQGRDYPRPPYTPDRYITDWDRAGGGDRGPGSRPGADDRWAERPNYDRDFDRPSPPPGYAGEQGYEEAYRRGYDAGSRYADDRSGGAGDGSYQRGSRDERGFDPYARDRQAGRDGMHRMMHERMHGGHRDMDFRRDFAEDGRRGYYQDSSYEEMPRGRQRMGAGPGDVPPVDMREIREAMRTIDRFDVDGDNRVTQEEVDRYRSDRLNQFDTDADQQLTLEEYSALWSDAMREQMVRRFQGHDRDGDGMVTADEFSEQTRDLVRMRDRNRDEALSEDDFMRPRIEAPLEGGSPNQPGSAANNTGPVDTTGTGTGTANNTGTGTANNAGTGAANNTGTGTTNNAGTGNANDTGTGTTNDAGTGTQVEDEETTDTSTN